MDEKFDFRTLLLKLQDYFSDDDRRRLHFILGDTMPRHLRDDPTLSGTLSLLESLFDQATISEQDLNYLIHALNEINCHKALKRLNEHKLVQYNRNRCETTTTNVSDLLDDNEENKIPYNKNNSNFMLSNNSKERHSTSSQVTMISFDQKQINENKLFLTKSRIKFVEKRFKIDLICVKQTFKSRLTICQLVLFSFNIVSILTFIILMVFLTKPKHSMSDILLIKSGNIYGNSAGADAFNDAQGRQLTFTDRIVNINAGWMSDTLDYLTSLYSNNRSMQHGRATYRYSSYISEFALSSDESISGVAIYTDQGRPSELFGSLNGMQMDEALSNVTIAYVRGKALGYVEALQFIWYRQMPRSSSATLQMYQYYKFLCRQRGQK
ncbi:unnamed protein product [Rotaria socialis]|uniref:DED domain-containing protein n=1 Tax=Rotaria socialis TaxID=392032 RepID=A0A821JMI3_9BILA|nr:unnamed protein product [Rotaria socialis]